MILGLRSRTVVLVSVACVAIMLASALALRERFPTALFAAAVIVALAGLRWPLPTYYFGLLLLPTFSWAVFVDGVSPFQIVIAGAAVGVAIKHRHELRPLANRLVAQPPVFAAILLAVWIGIITVTVPAQGDVSFIRSYGGSVVLMCVGGVLLRTKQTRLDSLAVLVVGAVGSALVGVAQLLTTDAVVSAWVLPTLRVLQDNYIRLASPWGLLAAASDFGKDMSVATALSTALVATANSRRQRVVALAAMALLVLMVVMSGSRSAWLGSALALAYLAWVQPRAVARAALATCAIVLMVLLFKPSIPGDLQVRVGLPQQARLADAPAVQTPLPVPAEGAAPSTSPTENNSPKFVVGGAREQESIDISNSSRVRLLIGGAKMVLERPVAGFGADGFRENIDRYAPSASAGTETDIRARLSAHSVPMEFWVDFGTPGLALAIGFVVVVFIALERLRRRSANGAPLATAITAACIALLTGYLFHNYMFDKLLWALSAVVVSANLWNEEPFQPAPPQATTEPRIIRRGLLRKILLVAGIPAAGYVIANDVFLSDLICRSPGSRVRIL